jgi:diguanylate cyclase (GGDEF)-like protein
VNDQSVLLITNILLGLILNLALLAIARSYPESLKRSQKIWATAGLWVVLTWVLLGLRAFGFEALSVIGANTCLGMGLAEYGRGLQKFRGERPHIWRSIAIAAAFAAVTVLFYAWHPGRDLRAIFINIMAALVLFWCASQAHQGAAHAPLASLMVFWVIVMLALTQVLRAGYILLHMPMPPGQAFVLQLITAGSTACFAMLAFAFSILCNERLNSELQRRVRYDSLTGCLNRAPWRAEFDGNFEGGRQLSALLFDIDHFKAFNDQHGHSAGDAVLQSITACARALFGESVGRLGGEEFGVFLAGKDEAEAFACAERFRRAIAHLAIVHQHASLKATVSIGVAQAQHFSTAKDLLKAADDAMYAAKRAGRNVSVLASTLAA